MGNQPELNPLFVFLKGRVGRKVSDFFMDFLAASEGMNAKVQNKGLVQALDDYCESAELNKNESLAYRQQVYSYCNEQLQSGEEITLNDLSQELPPIGDQTFLILLSKMIINWKRVSRQIAVP